MTCVKQHQFSFYSSYQRAVKIVLDLILNTSRDGNDRVSAQSGNQEANFIVHKRYSNYGVRRSVVSLLQSASIVGIVDCLVGTNRLYRHIGKVQTPIPGTVEGEGASMTSRKPCSDASLPCSHLVERINKGDGVIIYRPLAVLSPTCFVRQRRPT
jgi:hypothetical protein